MAQGRTADDLAACLRGRGAVPAAKVRTALGVSRATLFRLFRDAGPQVLRLGAGPATCYALAAGIEGLPTRLPVYRVDPHGQVQQVAELLALHGGGCWFEPAGQRARTFVGLPPFVHDMAPSGYLGARFARRHPELALPAHLQDWDDRHRLAAVGRRGEDCAGDLIVGEESLDRFLGMVPTVVGRDGFVALAEETAVRGGRSSAAGEQPKFTAVAGGSHCLVKFSNGDGSPSERRWQDLLVCEALAAQTLAEHGLPAASCEVVDAGRRRFLVVERFDRVGASGRRGCLGLGVIDDEYFGQRDDWCAAAGRLQAAGMLSADDAHRLRLLDAFGACIGNGDRHFGNVTFYCDELQPQAGLALAPVYDMLPMDAAPSAGTLPPLPPMPQRPRARHLQVWDEARALAVRFFQQARTDERLSRGFRRMLGQVGVA